MSDDAQAVQMGDRTASTGVDGGSAEFKSRFLTCRGMGHTFAPSVALTVTGARAAVGRDGHAQEFAPILGGDPKAGDVRGGDRFQPDRLPDSRGRRARCFRV